MGADKSGPSSAIWPVSEGRGQYASSGLSALLFLYREVLGSNCPGWTTCCGKKPQRRPVVLSHGEVERLLAVLEGTMPSWPA